jgi:hypothetical protein
VCVQWVEFEDGLDDEVDGGGDGAVGTGETELQGGHRRLAHVLRRGEYQIIHQNIFTL